MTLNIDNQQYKNKAYLVMIENVPYKFALNLKTKQ